MGNVKERRRGGDQKKWKFGTSEEGKRVITPQENEKLSAQEEV